MATPTNLPATAVTGEVLTAAYVNNLRGAFRILQVISTSATASVSSASATWVDTGLTASITPQSTTSKILVIYSQNVYTNAAATGGGLRLDRSGTVLRTETDLSFGNVSGCLVQHCFVYFDSPVTTSALTYKTQQQRSNGAGTVFTQANVASNTATMTLMEISL